MGDDPGRLQPLAAFELRARAAGEAARALFVKGDGEPTAVHPSDVVQGQHYDCFLMGAMALIAQQHPDPDRWMRDLIEVNPDGSYTVTLHEWIMANPITGEPAGFRLVTEVVRDTLPASASSDDNEKWVAVIEKAYGQRFPSAPGDQPFPKGTGGSAGDAMSRLTGLPSQALDLEATTLDQLAELHAKGWAIAAGTDTPSSGLPHDRTSHPLYQPGGLTPDGQGWAPPSANPVHNDELKTHHVYYVTGVDRAAGTVTINNVWDAPRQDLVIPYDQFQAAFASLNANPVHARERPR